MWTYYIQDYAAFREWGSRRIDGNTPAADRQRYIDDFNSSHKPDEIGSEDPEDRKKISKQGTEGKKDRNAEESKTSAVDEKDGLKDEKHQQIFLFFLSTKAGGQVRGSLCRIALLEGYSS